MYFDELYYAQEGACVCMHTAYPADTGRKITLMGFQIILYDENPFNAFRLQPEAMFCTDPNCALPLTCLCPKSFRMVASFLVLAYWRWATMAGLGSLQSTESRWSHMLSRCRWGCFRLGSKQWTSHPALAREFSRDRSSTPNLQPTQCKQSGCLCQRWGWVLNLILSW